MLPEIVFAIFEFLPPKEIFICRQVCILWCYLAETFLRKGLEIEYKWYQSHLKFQELNHPIKSDFHVTSPNFTFVDQFFVSNLGLTFIIKKIPRRESFWYYLLIFNYVGEHFEEFLCDGEFREILLIPSDSSISIVVEKKILKSFNLQTFSIFEENHVVTRNHDLQNNTCSDFSQYFRTDRFSCVGEHIFPCRNNPSTKLHTRYNSLLNQHSFVVSYKGVDYSYVIEQIESFNDKKTCLIKLKSDIFIYRCVFLITCDPEITKYRHFIECYLLNSENNDEFPIFCSHTKRFLITKTNFPHFFKVLKIDEFNK